MSSSSKSLFVRWQQTRDPALRPGVLKLAFAVLRARTRTWPDPDEVAQLAWIKVHEKLEACVATTDGQFRAWLARIARNTGSDSRPRGYDLLDDELRADPHTAPDHLAQEAARQRARALLFSRVETLAAIPERHLPAARRTRVAATLPGRRRDVEILVATRIHADAAIEVARRFGVSLDIVKQARVRGAATLAVVARVLLDEGGLDALLVEALQEMAERLDL